MRALFVVILLAAAASCAPSPAAPAPPSNNEAPPPKASAPPARVIVSGPDASRVSFARMAKYPEPGWNVPRHVEHSPDGKQITFLASEAGDETMSLFALDPATGKSEVLLRAGDLGKSSKGALSQEEELRRERQRDRNEGITNYTWAERAPVLVIPHHGDVFVRDARPGRPAAVRALTSTPEPELDAKPCATGERVAFVRGGELVAVDVATGREVFATRGAAAGVTRGQSDFNGQEELGEPSGFFWSPRCDRLVYLEVDERPVSTVPVLGYRGGNADLMMERYPRAGEKNPIVRAGVVDLATKKTTWLGLPEGGERYLGRFRWTDDGKALYLQTVSRDQKRLALLRADAGTGVATEITSETSPAWVTFSPMRLLPKTGGLLFTTTTSGHRQLELRSALTGALVRTLTGADWDVDEIVGIDEERGRVVVSGTREGPLERHAYAVPFAGGAPVRLTAEHGTHAVKFDESGRGWVDVHSAQDRAPVAAVMDATDKKVAELPVRADDDLTSLALRTPELVTLPSPGGQTLHGALLAPRVITGKHPVVIMVYGGPTAQLVQDRWAPRLLWQHLADRGFVVFQLDNRGSGGQGVAFSQLVHRRLGKLELEDQVAGARWLASLPYVDASRIGIYGHSYGGFMAALAMLDTKNVFRAAVAGAPVTDWRLYDTGYTERFMATPAQNPEGYAASDLSKKAERLEGKLLLVHAQMDENVHYQHTAQLVDALVAAGKPFELLVLPGERHGQRTPGTRAYVSQRVATFFAENL
jgi:dipeptidyl-peptidase 4